MSQITFEVSRNGKVTQLQEKVEGNQITDLIKSLKMMKESTNELLTKLLREENDKNSRKADDKDNDSDDTEDESQKEEPRKKLKS